MTMFEGTALAVKRKVAPSPANDILEVATRITAETTRQIAANWRMQVPVQSDEMFRLEDAVKSDDDVSWRLGRMCPIPCAADRRTFYPSDSLHPNVKLRCSR